MDALLPHELCRLTVHLPFTSAYSLKMPYCLLLSRCLGYWSFPRQVVSPTMIPCLVGETSYRVNVRLLASSLEDGAILIFLMMSPSLCLDY